MEEKNNRLINIYIKIYNKKNITMDDLRYLAKYDTECFRKTCENVVYNFPESEIVMKADDTEVPAEESMQTDTMQGAPFDVLAVLNNLKQMETGEVFYKNVDFKRVKNLLGNLFMEMLFPHNDQDMFIQEKTEDEESSFDMKA